MERYYGYGDKVYATEVDGHDVAIEFDKKLLVVNRVRLYVDGAQVDEAKVVYGDKTLGTTTADGVRVEVTIDSGGGGELTRAQAKRSDGSWVDLEERTAQAQP